MEGPVTWDEIEPNKYLLADKEGFLHLLLLLADHQIRHSELGRVSPGAQVRYIDNRVVYAGVYAGPSSLLRITQNALEPIASFPNPGPLLDMAAVQGAVPGETHLLAAGGYEAVGEASGAGLSCRPRRWSKCEAAWSASRSLLKMGKLGKLGKLGKPKRRGVNCIRELEKPEKLEKLEKLEKPWKRRVKDVGNCRQYSRSAGVNFCSRNW